MDDSRIEFVFFATPLTRGTWESIDPLVIRFKFSEEVDVAQWNGVMFSFPCEDEEANEEFCSSYRRFFAWLSELPPSLYEMLEEDF